MASGMDQGSNLCSVIYNPGGLGSATAPVGLSVIPLCQMELPRAMELGDASRQPQAQTSTDGHP